MLRAARCFATPSPNIRITQGMPTMRKSHCRTYKHVPLFLFTLLWCNLSSAHSRWVVPSHTTLSGDKPVSISVDFSISNELFHGDIAMGGESPTAVAAPTITPPQQHSKLNPMQRMLNATRVNYLSPNGEISNDLPIVNLGRKSSSTFELTTSGTYRVNVIQAPIDLILYENGLGETHRMFGKLRELQNTIPKAASNIKTLRISNDIHSYITRNNITGSTIEPKGKGLELRHHTHPNDLFSGESSDYSVLLDGKALSNASNIENTSIKVTRHNTRYRDIRNSITPTINSHGEFSINWKESGLYLVEGEISLPSGEEARHTEIFSFYMTLEVYPP